MSGKNNNSYQNLPDVPWWMIIVGFATFTPVGIALLLYKIFRESKPNPQRWNQQQSTVRQDTSYNVRQDTNYDVRRSADGSKQVTIEQSRRPAPTPQRTQIKSHSQRSGGSYTPQRRFPYVKLKSGKAFTIWGAILALVFGTAVGSVIIDWGFSYPQYILEEAFVPFIFAGIGVGLIIWGQHKSRQTKKFKRYLARIGNEPLIPLRPLAESLPADMDEVCNTLQDMIDLGVFGDRAYLDVATETLVVDNSVAKPVQKPKAAPAQPAPDLSSEDKILQEIRDANDRIPDAQISRKIDRIEEITRHILNYLKKHPERSSELHTFLDYYLPTTLKMLNTYAELDAQQLDGDNIAATKGRIENILDKVVEGFELQLDKLFEGDMLDISSDIDVMEKMLQRDGLSGEMKIPKAPPAPQEPAGYTPKLTLTPDQPGSGASAAAAAPQPEEKRGYDDLGVW